LKKVKKTR